MHLSDFQEQIRQLYDTVRHPRVGAVLGLHEEVGELSKVVMNREVYDQKDEDNLKQELADCFISLLDVANVYGIDLETACSEKLDEMRRNLPAWQTAHSLILQLKRVKFD